MHRHGTVHTRHKRQLQAHSQQQILSMLHNATAKVGQAQSFNHIISSRQDINTKAGVTCANKKMLKKMQTHGTMGTPGQQNPEPRD